MSSAASFYFYSPTISRRLPFLIIPGYNDMENKTPVAVSEIMAIDIQSCRKSLLERQRLHQDLSQKRAGEVLQSTVAAANAIMPGYPGVLRAYLFGSAIRPAGMHRTSDIDIGIEGRITGQDYFNLWRELELALTDYEIDLVELGADLSFSDNIRRTGRVIYERLDPNP